MGPAGEGVRLSRDAAAGSTSESSTRTASTTMKEGEVEETANVAATLASSSSVPGDRLTSSCVGFEFALGFISEEEEEGEETRTSRRFFTKAFSSSGDRAIRSRFSSAR